MLVLSLPTIGVTVSLLLVDGSDAAVVVAVGGGVVIGCDDESSTTCRRLRLPLLSVDPVLGDELNFGFCFRARLDWLN